MKNVLRWGGLLRHGYWQMFSVRDFSFFHALKLFVLGSCVGWLAWGAGGIEQLAWIIILPLAWGKANSRWGSAALMAGYYLAAARGVIEGAKVFFGDDVGYGQGLVFWVSACVFLTGPFFFLWSEDFRKRPWRFLGAVAISVVPPLAIIGWFNLLAVAGVFFPGFGWVGLGLTLGMIFVLVGAHWRWIAVFLTIALTSNVMAMWVSPQEPPTWQGVDTSFSELSSGGAGDAGRLLGSMKRVQWIKQFATSIPAGHVRVLPETVAGVFDGMSENELETTEADLRARGARLVVGAEVPQKNGQYKNVLLVLGAEKNEDRVLVQSIPVPISMWKPWADDGAMGNLFGRDNFAHVKGFRVSGVICYEQMLVYSLLLTMLDKPDILMAVSNVWWARDTSVPGIQLQMSRVFGRLFGVGVVVARNGLKL